MRLFIAFELPAPWRDAAGETQSVLRRAADPRVLRFVEPELMHLTLRFLGEVTDEAVDALARELEREFRLEDVDVELRLSAAGTFGPPARTAVAWLGVDGARDARDALVARLETAVTGVGLAGESRPFRPHLTLARVHRSASADQRRAIAAAVAELAPPPPAPARFRELAVVRSHLGGARPRYETLARYPRA